jgi:hypothetical protein
MTDPKNKAEDSQVWEEDEDLSLTSELYRTGIDRLYKNNYLLIPDVSGKYAYHKVYHLVNPIDGEIKYPDNFKTWQEISSNNVRELLQNVIAGWSEEDLRNFWWVLVKPNKAKSSALYMYTELVLEDQGIQEKKDSGKPLNYYQTPNPIVSEDPKESKELAPRVWIPREEWFPEEVKQVTIKDILTIFPETEQDLLALILGRAVVGRSNHIPPGWDKPIIHTSRMAALTLGEDPGLGKTNLFKTFFSALETVGFVIETFDKFGSQFNMGPIISADIVYRDDLTDKDLKSLLDSGVAKSTISGSDQIKVQDKGVDAHNVFPRACIIANTNNFNPRLIWGIDPGFADRIKLLATLREAELEQIELTPLSQGSTDVRPFVHFPYLAEKTGVSIKTIMLWFARLCADKFLKTLEDRTSLEYAVDRYTLRLREPLHKDSTSQLMTSALFCGALLYTHVGSDLVNHNNHISGYDWDKSFEALSMVVRHRKYFEDVLQYLREDFDGPEKPDTLHPLIGLISVDPSSLKNWDGQQNDHADKRHDYLLWLKEAMKVIRMNNGLHYSQDEVWLTKAFKKIYFYLPEIRAKVVKAKKLDSFDLEVVLSVIKKNET